TLNGTVNPNGNSTTVTFVYGTDPLLMSGTTTVTADSGLTGTSTLNESYALTDLTQNTTYYVEEVATSAGGTSTGSILSFTTGGGIIVTSTADTRNYSTSVTVAGLTNPNNITLLDAIDAVNNTPGNIEIDLATNAVYNLTSVNNSTDGPTALPLI